MSYPILYKSNETDFFTMGLGPIQMLKATVTQERNGIFIFEGEILTDNPLFPLVLENYIIKADADHLLKDQRFRIKRIVPNHDGKAQIYAEHVSYLSRELTIKPEVNITGSAQIALNQWKSSIVESNPFVVSSDITTSASTKWRIDKVENPMVALGGVEGSILERWGGEYLFDNYHISLLKKRGKTATNILAYGRNITDFEQERNILSTYTSIAPYAIYTDDNEKETIVTVDGFVVDSEHVNKFPNRVTKPIDFSSEFGSDEIPTKARLTTLAQQYITGNEIGVPTTSIKISFLDLSQTADYAEYAFLEQVNLCDDVRVHYPKLGVNTIAKVVRVIWNCLTESYDEIEIGQKRMSLASQIQEQNKVIQEINTQVNQSQVSADGKNMIFYGLYGENGLGEPNAIKIGDSWFKPNGLETELYVWTGIEWKLIMSTSSFSEINETIKDLDGELELATTNANDAVNKAGQAIRDAGFATDIAEDAKALGVTASTLADEAKTNASTAMADAQEAIRQAGITGGVATEARRLAGLAEDNAQEALTKANTSVTDASKALTDATKAFNKSFKSSSVAYTTSTNGTTPPTTGWGTTVPSPSPDVYIWTRTTIVLNDNTPVVSYSVGKIGAKGDQGLKGDIGGQGIQGVPGANAPTIKSVVQQRYLSTSKTSQTGGSWLDTVPVWSSDKYYWIRVVTTYSNNATSQSTPVLDNALNDSLITALEAKTANQTLSTTVTQHATLIQGKANSTTVDAIEGRVTTTEGSISAVAGEVALKASAEDVNALTGRVSTAEGNITTQAGQIALRATTATVNALTGRVSAAESSLSVQSGKIDLAATKTELTTAIDGIQVGGRNLYIVANSEKGYMHRNDGGMTTAAPKGERTSEYIEIGNAKNITISYVMYPTPNYKWYGYSFYDANKVNIGGRPAWHLEGTENSTTTEVRTLNVPDNAVYIRVSARWLENEQCKLQVEKGNKATDWTPAPEDVDKSISTVQANLTVEAGKITALTTKTNGHTTQIGTLQTGYDGLSSTVTELETGKVDNTAFSALEQNLSGFKTTVQNTYETKSVVAQLAGQWSATVAKVDGHTGQITNLGTDINLRVKKDSLIGEINLQAGKTIFRQGDNVMMITPTTTYIQDATIKTAHIADLAVSDAKIANASISSAKIISLDVSKLYGQTITGINYQNPFSFSYEGKTYSGTTVINNGGIGQNASATDGTPASFRVTAGEVSTQIGNRTTNIYPGRIRFTRGTGERAMIFYSDEESLLYVNGQTGSGLGAYRNYNGEEQFTPILKVITDWQGTSRIIANARINAQRVHFANGGTIYDSGDTFLMGTEQNNINVSIKSSQLLALESDDLRLNNRLIANNAVRIRNYNGQPMIQTLINKTGVLGHPSTWLSEIYVNAMRGETLNIGYGQTDSSKGDLRVDADANGGRLVSNAVYNRTSSNPSNVGVTSYGMLYRVTSAKKYKTDIVASDMSHANKVLFINPKNWIDKNGVYPGRQYGFIADEFHELGLTEVVQYGADGQVEGLAYDRISMYHNVILKDHEHQLSTVTQQLTTVATERLQHTLLLESKLLSLENTVLQLQREIEQLK